MHLIFSPLGFGLLLAALLLALWNRLPKLLRWLCFFMEMVSIALCCPFGANALVWQLESRVPKNEMCEGPTPTTIVVLSGGLERAPTSADDFSALDADSVQRLLAAVVLWKRDQTSTFVVAGGGPFSIRESDVLSHLAAQLGVPAQAIRREDKSQTTWENAQQLRLLQPPLPTRIWLVSSAMHLPRAQIAFRAAGFDACLYMSDRDFLGPGGIGYFLPQSSAVRKSETALHELIGEVLYLWFARSSKSA